MLCLPQTLRNLILKISQKTNSNSTETEENNKHRNHGVYQPVKSVTYKKVKGVCGLEKDATLGLGICKSENTELHQNIKRYGMLAEMQPFNQLSRHAYLGHQTSVAGLSLQFA